MPPESSASRRPAWKTVLRAAALVLAAFALLLGAVVLWAQLTAWFPPPTERLSPIAGSPGSFPAGPSSLRIVTWNIGYAGLDKDTDFVMDGGRMSHPRSRQAVEENLAFVVQTLGGFEPDIAFVQEVDHDSARTWHIDERAALAARFPSHQLWYATNFRSPFVPFPASSPLASVESGIVTLTRFAAASGTRYQLPGTQPWPERLFQLKRCGMLVRLPSPVPGRDWCLLNVHLSAFDDGSQRAQELGFVKELATSLYAQGHYVVVGGDWNSVFPGVALDRFQPWVTADKDLFWVRRIPDGWTPQGWSWAYDAGEPSVRTDEKPYRPNQNYRTIIDGFLLSPNVRLVSVKTSNLQFGHSDHEPVVAQLQTADLPVQGEP